VHIFLSSIIPLLYQSITSGLSFSSFLCNACSFTVFQLINHGHEYIYPLTVRTGLFFNTFLLPFPHILLGVPLSCLSGGTFFLYFAKNATHLDFPYHAFSFTSTASRNHLGSSFSPDSSLSPVYPSSPVSSSHCLCWWVPSLKIPVKP
jgi:hypothetical protein